MKIKTAAKLARRELGQEVKVDYTQACELKFAGEGKLKEIAGK